MNAFCNDLSADEQRAITAYSIGKANHLIADPDVATTVAQSVLSKLINDMQVQRVVLQTSCDLFELNSKNAKVPSLTSLVELMTASQG